MPDCNFKIDGPGSLKDGEAATYQVNPPLQHPCRTKIWIDGQPAIPGNTIGGLLVTQISLGMVSVKATKDNPTARVTIEVDCRDKVPPCGPTKKSVDVGTASPPFDWWEIPKTIGLPVSLPLCGICKFLNWLRKILNAAPVNWLCIFCDWLPDWWKGLW